MEQPTKYYTKLWHGIPLVLSYWMRTIVHQEQIVSDFLANSVRLYVDHFIQIRPPNGNKHKLIGAQQYAKILDKSSIEPAAKRGINSFRRIINPKYGSHGCSGCTLSESTDPDRLRLTMMSDYFAQRVDEYKGQIEKCKEDARRKREQLQQSQQAAPVNLLEPFEMSKKWYNMMDADISQVFSYTVYFFDYVHV